MRRRSTTAGSTTPTPEQMPRDVEAVEAVIDRLDGGISNEAHGHVVITETLVTELQIGYGAAWLPAADGSFHLRGQSGPLTGAGAPPPGGWG
jgi:hypothetical protein